MITNCVAIVNKSKLSLSDSKMRETLLPCFLYVSKCMIMAYRSCPVMAQLFFKHKAIVCSHPSAFPSLMGATPNLPLAGWRPQGPFSCQGCLPLHHLAASAKQPTRQFGPRPGNERKWGIAVGRNLPGWGPRSAAPRAGKLGHLTVS